LYQYVVCWLDWLMFACINMEYADWNDLCLLVSICMCILVFTNCQC